MMTRSKHREHELHISTKYKSEFQAGVTALLRSWPVLKTAVEQQWGSIDSAAKAEDLRRNIFEAFDLSTNKKSIDVFDLQENIFLYMEEEFSVILEDDSDRQVAEMICRLFEQCIQEDLTFYREVIELVNKANAMPKDKIMLKVEGELDEDSGDEDGMEVDDDVMTDVQQNDVNIVTENIFSNMSMREYVSAPLFGSDHNSSKKNAPTKPARQLGEEEPQKLQLVEVDDDGFATVAKPTRKSRRSKN